MIRHRNFPLFRFRPVVFARGLLVWLVASLLMVTLVRADETVVSGSAGLAAARQVETIVCIRHGEKLKAGLGNLDTEGLNRALALPEVLLSRYGTPGYIFAPDPGADKVSEGAMMTDGTAKGDACYVRPLLTIGPTAIRCGLPINTTYGFKHIAGLEQELDEPAYRNAVIFIAWEHRLAEQFMKDEVREHGGNADAVPDWPREDFDSIYVARISRDGKGAATVAFQVDHEDLNGMSSDFPQPAGVKPK
jgi:hypothetical protein